MHKPISPNRAHVLSCLSAGQARSPENADSNDERNAPWRTQSSLLEGVCRRARHSTVEALAQAFKVVAGAGKMRWVWYEWAAIVAPHTAAALASSLRAQSLRAW